MSKDILFSTFPELKNVSFSKDGKREVQSFVLRTNPLSSTLTNNVIKYYKDFAHPYNVSAIENNEKIDFKSLFQNDNDKIVIEIGFGNGASFVETAKKNKEINYFGFEVYLNGWAECLTSIGEANIKNAKVMRSDVHPILEHCVNDNSIDGFNIYFPDPWPKKKHHKRRLINDSFTSLLTSKLKIGGFVHFATDIEDYANEALLVFENNPCLKNKYEAFAPSSLDREHSTFEQKAIMEGRRIFDIYFVKVEKR